MTRNQVRCEIALAGIHADALEKLEQLTQLIEDTDVEGGWCVVAELAQVNAKLQELLEFVRGG